MSSSIRIAYCKIKIDFFALINYGITIAGGFRISGKVCSQCSVLDPLIGELTVEASGIPIQSIDIHLLRVESILIGDKIATETTSIQTTQARTFLC